MPFFSHLSANHSISRDYLLSVLEETSAYLVIIEQLKATSALNELPACTSRLTEVRAKAFNLSQDLNKAIATDDFQGAQAIHDEAAETKTALEKIATDVFTELEPYKGDLFEYYEAQKKTLSSIAESVDKKSPEQQFILEFLKSVKLSKKSAVKEIVKTLCNIRYRAWRVENQKIQTWFALFPGETELKSLLAKSDHLLFIGDDFFSEYYPKYQERMKAIAKPNPALLGELKEILHYFEQLQLELMRFNIPTHHVPTVLLKDLRDATVNFHKNPTQSLDNEKWHHLAVCYFNEHGETALQTLKEEKKQFDTEWQSTIKTSLLNRLITQMAEKADSVLFQATAGQSLVDKLKRLKSNESLIAISDELPQLESVKALIDNQIPEDRLAQLVLFKTCLGAIRLYEETRKSKKLKKCFEALFSETSSESSLSVKDTSQLFSQLDELLKSLNIKETLLPKPSALDAASSEFIATQKAPLVVYKSDTKKKKKKKRKKYIPTQASHSLQLEESSYIHQLGYLESFVYEVLRLSEDRLINTSPRQYNLNTSVPSLQAMPELTQVVALLNQHLDTDKLSTMERLATQLLRNNYRAIIDATLPINSGFYRTHEKEITSFFEKKLFADNVYAIKKSYDSLINSHKQILENFSSYKERLDSQGRRDRALSKKEVIAIEKALNALGEVLFLSFQQLINLEHKALLALTSDERNHHIAGEDFAACNDAKQAIAEIHRQLDTPELKQLLSALKSDLSDCCRRTFKEKSRQVQDYCTFIPSDSCDMERRAIPALQESLAKKKASQEIQISYSRLITISDDYPESFESYAEEMKSAVSSITRVNSLTETLDTIELKPAQEELGRTLTEELKRIRNEKLVEEKEILQQKAGELYGIIQYAHSGNGYALDDEHFYLLQQALADRRETLILDNEHFPDLYRAHTNQSKFSALIQLLSKLKEGDQDALNALFLPYFPHRKNCTNIELRSRNLQAAFNNVKRKATGHIRARNVQFNSQVDTFNRRIDAATQRIDLEANSSGENAIDTLSKSLLCSLKISTSDTRRSSIYITNINATANICARNRLLSDKDRELTSLIERLSALQGRRDHITETDTQSLQLLSYIYQTVLPNIAQAKEDLNRTLLQKNMTVENNPAINLLNDAERDLKESIKTYLRDGDNQGFKSSVNTHFVERFAPNSACVISNNSTLGIVLKLLRQMAIAIVSIFRAADDPSPRVGANAIETDIVNQRGALIQQFGFFANGSLEEGQGTSSRPSNPPRAS